MKTKIQTIGHITKQEALQILNFNIEANTTVLETIRPFPGYHREVHDKGTPQTVFFILKHPMYREDVSRLSKKLREDLAFDFNIVHSKVVINNQTYIAIRAFNISNYENVHLLQKAIISEGIIMYSGKILPGEALITNYKQFDLSESETGTYKSNRNNDFFYFKIPKNISWEDFKEVTMSVRNSWDLINFDAALGILYIDNQIEDVIRIFAKDTSENDIDLIKEKFLLKIK
jgi:hypothetical protein